MRLTKHGFLLATLGLLASTGVWPLVAAHKTDAHARWRAQSESSVVLERWFVPGMLGYEAGAVTSLSSRAFLTRALSGVETTDNGAWAGHNQITPRLNFSHNLSRVFPVELFVEHPEFFPDEAGRRLQPTANTAWWNPDLGRADVAAYAAGKAREFFAAKPEATSFALGVNDGLIFGESTETKTLVTPVRWFRGRPDYSNLVFTFMNRAAESLARTHPTKYLGALAYYWAEDAPDFLVHRQVVPFLTADRAQGYDAQFRREEGALWQRWIDRTGGFSAQMTGRRIGLYDYLYGSGYLVPRFHPYLIAEYLRRAKRLGFTDYYAEMYPNWGLDGPQPWLVAQLLQDPKQSAGKLLDEYFRRYFKEAAAPMRRFFSRCERQWMRQEGPAYWLKHYRNESQAVLFPTGVCVELRALLNEASRRAGSDLVRARVQQVSDAFGVTERFVAMQEARDQLARLALAAKPDAVKLRRGSAEFAAARMQFEHYTKALQQAQPGLIAPFKFSDYLMNDPRAMAAAACDEPLKPGARWQSLPINGSFSGKKRAARDIAELTYSVALPEPWRSQVEPSEHHVARVEGETLWISGTKDTAVFQWVAIPKGASELRTTVEVRGEVSVSGVVSLTLGWLDAQHRHLGLTILRLPDGQWPEWRTLLQEASPPPGAAWVGVGARVQHQQSSDWVELKNFALLWRP